MTAAVSPRLATPPAAPRSVRRAVVVGAGSAGRRHLHNLASLGVDAVALRSGLGQAEALGALQAWPEVHDWDDVAAFAPEIAIIATPTSVHVSGALAAARAGCHLLVEKPVSHTLDGLDALAREVDARGLTALVGYQLRFHPTLRRVREWIADGWIGDVVSAHAHWGEHLPHWHPGEDHRLGYSARADLGGGVVRTLSHPLDYLRWLLGEVEAVSALTARRARLTVDVEDVASVSLRFASGALGTVTLDYAEWPARHALAVVGTDGKIVWNAADGIARAWRTSAGPWASAAPPATFQRNTMFVAELEHFLARVADGGADGGGDACASCSLADGWRALELALAALRSAEEGRVVDV